MTEGPSAIHGDGEGAISPPKKGLARVGARGVVHHYLSRSPTVVGLPVAGPGHLSTTT